ncbi:MAG: tetratricopeptide repeat protein [Bacteroidota bacterium]|nr:tetratricopeptide repeat protein [Bacteroidota bacterium]
MLRKILIILLFVFGCLGYCQAQKNSDKNNFELAKHYINMDRYQEACKLLEDLIDKEFKSDYYNALFLAYEKLEKEKEKEKLIKLAIKKSKVNYQYYIDYGLLYYARQDSTKADKMFNKAINSLTANNTNIYSCASYFSNNRLYDYALKTYQKGRILLKDENKYRYEISFILQIQGMESQIIDEYLVLLENNPKYLNNIQVNINSLLDRDKDDKLLTQLHNTLLEKVKENPKNEQLCRLYLWTLIKEKKYEQAFLQAKAINSRFENNEGGSVFSFGEIAMNNQEYSFAQKAFDVIINNNNDNNAYYTKSVINKVYCYYNAFKDQNDHSNKDLENMNLEFEKAINILGKNSISAPVLQEYSHFLAYYKHSSQQAVDILDIIINMNSLSAKQRALAKIDRGDIYLMEGDVWAASLEYSQVSKDFKNEHEGSIAKFKNAMLSYYVGDFEWALSQFSSLRSSTSKLIANDAMEYSLLIKENMDEDSSYNALSYFAKADFLFFQKKYNEAMQQLSIIETSYSIHNIFDEVLYKKGQIAYEQKNYNQADSLWQTLLMKYPYDIMADDALWSLAQMYENIFRDKTKALEFYQRIIIDYPSSLYVAQSRKKNEELSK